MTAPGAAVRVSTIMARIRTRAIILSCVCENVNVGVSRRAISKILTHFYWLFTLVL